MNDTNLTTLGEIKDFLDGSLQFHFQAKNMEETYAWICESLIRFQYYKLEKPEKSNLKLYLQKVTGYSRSQITRFIHSQRTTGKVVRTRYVRRHFSTKYSQEDIQLLAETDVLHDTPNGRAIKRILEREWEVYNRQEFQNLSAISVPQIYRFRKGSVYRRINLSYQKTKPIITPIGERRKPVPNGLPGYLRVDTVHQGDLEREKGVYHINIVDEVTQFQFMGAVETISESHLVPMLNKLIDLFPFRIIEIHSDNGKEYVNQYVAKLLQKLLITLTKSRARKSNDNALVESKNGSTIRKWIGYPFLPKGAAKELNIFYFGSFHAYLNFHKPCAFPHTITNEKGKQQKTYPQRNYLTPFEKLMKIPMVEMYLKNGVTIEALQAIATTYSDNEMAAIVQKERSRLFETTDR